VCVCVCVCVRERRGWAVRREGFRTDERWGDRSIHLHTYTHTHTPVRRSNPQAWLTREWGGAAILPKGCWVSVCVCVCVCVCACLRAWHPGNVEAERNGDLGRGVCMCVCLGVCLGVSKWEDQQHNIDTHTHIHTHTHTCATTSAVSPYTFLPLTLSLLGLPAPLHY
jgi:hypothetical protein